MNIIQTAKHQTGLKTLLKAMRSLGLTEVLSGNGPFTLFAPTDEAFTRLPSEIIEVLFRNRLLLNDVLTLHLINDKIMTSNLKGKQSLKGVSGGRLHIIIDRDDFFISGARVIQSDIACTNGVIHVVDAVIFPEEMQSADAVQINNKFQKEGKA
jgi:transforming growth factor-beta-induced protein